MSVEIGNRLFTAYVESGAAVILKVCIGVWCVWLWYRNTLWHFC